MKRPDIAKWNQQLLLMALLFGGLWLASSFLVPVAFAALLSMILMPLVKKLEKNGWHPVLATFTADAILMLVSAGFLILLSAQFYQLAKEFPKIKSKLTSEVDRIRENIDLSGEKKPDMDEAPDEERAKEKDQTPAQKHTQADSTTTQKQSSKEPKKQIDKGGGILNNIESVLRGFAANLGTILTQLLLVFVYVFLFLHFRKRFYRFMFMKIPDEDHERAKTIIEKSVKMSFNYLFGKLITMGFLFVVYAVGLLLIGVNYGLIYAAIAALLTVIPFLGNIIGGAIPMMMAYVEQGSTEALLVLALFTAAQLIENYVLSPLVIGDKVDINPVFTIVIVVLGSYVWGVAGTILSIPILGIIRIVMVHIEGYDAYAYLIGTERITEEKSKEK